MNNHLKSLTLAAALLLSFAGCGRETPEPRPARQPERKGGGGELRVILPLEPRVLDPNSMRDEAALVVAPSVFSKLVTLDVDARLLPQLAESWTTSPDGRVYTFRLRDGVRWHDGHPFSADDVRWSLTALGREPSFATEVFQRIAAIETPDPRTVVIRLREPWSPFLSMLAWYGTYILPRHRQEARGAHGFQPGELPVGTGPFRVESWEPGRSITLAANRAYFRPGPYLDRVVYLLRSAGEGVDLLLAGQADYFGVRPPVDRLPELARSPDLAILTRPSDSRFYCGFNLRRGPLADRRVREAVNRAIDRKALLEKAFAGYGAPALGFYTPAVAWAYDAQARVPDYDPERARALLDEAGLRPGPDGVRVRWDMVAPDILPIPDMVRVLAAQLREVGVEIRPVLLPLAEWAPRLLNNHDFDLGIMGGNQGPDPENLNLRFGSRGPTQFMGYSSPELDAAVAEGSRAADLPRRAAAYFRAQRILARDLPIAPLAESVYIAVMRRQVHGTPHAEARGLVPNNDFSLVRLEP
ncbi:MAG TPA: ABC transporter substrate-binding protein [Thermoanaerobaculia bacterium]|nr:ABC transporter substrate-binding protein [Thermoanaerobaculia bacterium]